MVSTISQSQAKGETSFYSGERIDLHHVSEHVTPSSEYFAHKQELARLANAATMAAEHINPEYVAEGIEQAERHLDTQAYYDYIAAASSNLTDGRKARIGTKAQYKSEKGKLRSVFHKLSELIVGDDQGLKMPRLRGANQVSERELLQKESAIGRELFGEIPSGYNREFFNLDQNTWIWHEEHNDEGVTHATTTRYELQGDKILKAQDGAQYSYIEGDELRDLSSAVQMYYERVMREIYDRDPATGYSLTH